MPDAEFGWAAIWAGSARWAGWAGWAWGMPAVFPGYGGGGTACPPAVPAVVPACTSPCAPCAPCSLGAGWGRLGYWDRDRPRPAIASVRGRRAGGERERILARFPAAPVIRDPNGRHARISGIRHGRYGDMADYIATQVPSLPSLTNRQGPQRARHARLARMLRSRAAAAVPRAPDLLDSSLRLGGGRAPSLQDLQICSAACSLQPAARARMGAWAHRAEARRIRRGLPGMPGAAESAGVLAAGVLAAGRAVRSGRSGHVRLPACLLAAAIGQAVGRSHCCTRTRSLVASIASTLRPSCLCSRVCSMSWPSWVAGD